MSEWKLRGTKANNCDSGQAENDQPQNEQNNLTTVKASERPKMPIRQP